MHELSIAMSIVEIAEEEADQRGGARVSAVHLKLGALAGVVKDAAALVLRTGLRGHRFAGIPVGHRRNSRYGELSPISSA
jgi:Zn finger protein HypA/HybF involved in hydrogenase expression